MGSKYLFKLEYDNEKFSSFFVNLYEKKDYNFADLTNDIRSYVRSLQYVTPSTIRIRFKDDDGDYVNLSYGDGEMFKEMFETANPVKDRDYKRIYLKVSQLDSPVLNPLRFQSRSMLLSKSMRKMMIIQKWNLRVQFLINPKGVVQCSRLLEVNLVPGFLTV